MLIFSLVSHTANMTTIDTNSKVFIITPNGNDIRVQRSDMNIKDFLMHFLKAFCAGLHQLELDFCMKYQSSALIS